MLTSTKPALVLSLAGLLLVACKADDPTPTPVANQAAPAEPTEAGADQGAPKIASDEPVYEFGAIKAEDSVEHVFKIKNVGTADLHIERVQRT